ncbi:MAG TPA: hypothetical protein VFZ09_29030 [Archangium sp.]|uniref:hypothetical protein n=1 Tax=Archangium sp. TaxID=1872627 RepID=UPI002E36911D|nr:hypothetical protein [Archangium sp.]HEX5750310.1 hypothetical protein [Archangium sp.]
MPWALFQAAPAASRATRLPIRGLVRGSKGPVAGAVVLAAALGHDFDASHGIGPRGPLRLRPGDSWLRLVLVRVGPVRDPYEKFREDEEPGD